MTYATFKYEGRGGRKMADSGYTFKYTFKEALADWFDDNDKQGLQ